MITKLSELKKGDCFEVEGTTYCMIEGKIRLNYEYYTCLDVERGELCVIPHDGEVDKVEDVRAGYESRRL